MPPIILRPGITNRRLWHPGRRRCWKSVRKAILDRDDFTCQSCGHRALKWMHVHHIDDSRDNAPANLVTLCVACHAILHLGLSMMHGALQVYRAEESQLEIVQRTRGLVARGKSLDKIRKSFTLTEGRYAPSSLDYANGLVRSVGEKSRASLRRPLAAVFVRFQRWQLER